MLATDLLDLRFFLFGTGEDVAPFAHTTDIVLNRLKLVVWFDDRLSSEIKDEICSKLASALRALKSRISRICGINELERRTQSQGRDGIRLRGVVECHPE